MRMIEYIKDVKRWISKYPDEWKTSKRTIYIGYVNALYATAPHKWKLYNKLLNLLYKLAPQMN